MSEEYEDDKSEEEDDDTSEEDEVYCPEEKSIELMENVFLDKSKYNVKFIDEDGDNERISINVNDQPLSYVKKLSLQGIIN